MAIRSLKTGSFSRSILVGNPYWSTPYTQTVSGGGGWVATGYGPFAFGTWTDTNNLSRQSGEIILNLSNNGSYFGNSFGGSQQGWAVSQYTLNSGAAVPAGTYNGTLSLYCGGGATDGFFAWLVTPTKKYYLGSVNTPLNSQFTFTCNTVSVTESETMKLEVACADGSSYWAMEFRIYGFTLTKS